MQFASSLAGCRSEGLHGHAGHMCSILRHITYDEPYAQLTELGLVRSNLFQQHAWHLFE